MKAVPLVITDGDRDMKIAIDAIFPNSFHRWWLFHIKRRKRRK
jgi:hypothetical protein